MKINPSYSLLLMRDDGKTRSLRFSLGTLRFLCALMILCPLLLGLFGWFSVDIWLRYSDLRKQRQTTTEKLTQARIELERLQTLADIMQKNEPEKLLLQQQTIQKNKPKTIVEPSVAPKAQPESSQGEAIAEAASDSSEPAAQTNVPPAPQGDSNAPPTPPESAGNTILINPIDNGMSNIDNVKAIRTATNTLDVSFDLINTTGGRALEGDIAFFFQQGATPLQALEDAGDHSFRIIRFKAVKTKLPLTSPANPAVQERVIIEIKAKNGEIIYRSAFPVEHVS